MQSVFLTLSICLCVLGCSSHNHEASLSVAGENNPQPILLQEQIAPDGAKIRITAISLEHSIFTMQGEGFQPNEVIHFISNSCDEILSHPLQADIHGNIPAIGLAPAVLGKSGGTCHLDLLRDKNTLHVELPWGDAWQHTQIY